MSHVLAGLAATGTVLLLLAIIGACSALGGLIGSRIHRPDGLAPEGILGGGAIGFAVAFGVFVALTDAGAIR